MNYTVIAFTDLSKNQSIVPYPILAIGCQSLAVNRAILSMCVSVA
nr:MAG TPA: hypothetical protein [Caudoviricetes sp.]